MLKYLIMALGLSTYTQATELFHVFSPPMGQRFLHIKSSPLKSKFQITGTLSPRFILLNGEKANTGFKKVKCRGLQDMKINGEGVKTESKLRRFFKEVTVPANRNYFNISYRKGHSCYLSKISVKKGIFNRPISRRIIQNESSNKDYLLKLSGDHTKGETLKVDQGDLTIKGGKSYYEVNLKEGINHITGTYANSFGRENVLNLPVELSYERYSKNSIVLSLEKSLEWDKQQVETDKEEIIIKGQANPNLDLYLNGDDIDVESDGSFEYELELEKKVTELNFTVRRGSESKTFKRVILFTQYRQRPPWYRPMKVTKGKYYFNFNLNQVYYAKSREVHDTRFQENLSPGLSIAKKWSEEHFYEFGFRFFNHRSYHEGNTWQEINDHYYFYAKKIFDRGGGLFYGLGVGYKFGDYTLYHYSSENTGDSFGTITLDASISYRMRISGKFYFHPRINYLLPVGVPKRAESWNLDVVPVRFGYEF